MQRAMGQTNTTARKIEQRFQRMSGIADNAFGKIATVYASAQALRGATALIDANTRIQNSLKVAGLEGEELSRVYDSLYASAQRNAAPIDSLVTLYSRAAQSADDLGVSQAELLKFSDNVALALRVSGQSAQEASGALLQLGQALGNGTVQAEEYNSLIDGAQPLLQAVAAGLVEAGGSVSALTRLVKDGKVSSEAFFRAFEAGAYVLEEKVAGSELTVSQAFVRLQNVLIDVAGKFNESTGAGGQFADFLQLLGDRISIAGDNFDKGITPIQRFLGFIQDVSREAGRAVGADNIGKAIKEGLEDANGTIAQTEVALTEAEQALANFAANSKGRFGELDPVIQDFIQQLLEGRGTAETAAEAINAIGDAGDFGGLIGALGGLVQNLFAVRDAAIQARAAAQFQDVGSFPSQDEFNTTLGVKPPAPKAPITLASYPVGAGGAGAGGGSGGGSGRSAGDRFNEALEDQQRRIAELQRETELRRQLGAAYDENGFEAERLRVQLDLENEAARAGLELTPARSAAIGELATSYAQAAVEASQLAESQELATAAMENFSDAAESGIRGFIDDLIEGKSATEALGNALASIGNALLDFGLTSLFGMFKPGGGGLAALFPGRANGGPVTAGQPYIVGEKRPELFIPNQSGTIIPRIPTMPSTAAGGGGGQIGVEVQVGIDGNGNIAPVVTRIAGQVAGQAIKQNNKQLPGIMRDISQRTG